MSYVQVWIHAVWGTKNRESYLTKEICTKVICVRDDSTAVVNDGVSLGVSKILQPKSYAYNSSLQAGVTEPHSTSGLQP